MYRVADFVCSIDNLSVCATNPIDRNANKMAATESTLMPMPASPQSVSYKLHILPELPKDVAAVAQKQGENPSTVCANLEELRNMIFGMCSTEYLYGKLRVIYTIFP